MEAGHYTVMHSIMHTRLCVIKILNRILPLTPSLLVPWCAHVQLCFCTFFSWTLSLSKMDLLHTTTHSFSQEAASLRCPIPQQVSRCQRSSYRRSLLVSLTKAFFSCSFFEFMFDPLAACLSHWTAKRHLSSHHVFFDTSHLQDFCCDAAISFW